MCCACGMSPGWEKKIKKKEPRLFFTQRARRASFFPQPGAPPPAPAGAVGAERAMAAEHGP